jgi:hypothetical protein
MRKKAEDAKAVIDGNDNGAARGEPGAIVPRLGSGTGEKFASVNPEDDRQSGVRRWVWSPHV